jgi:hypothetical protein
MTEHALIKDNGELDSADNRSDPSSFQALHGLDFFNRKAASKIVLAGAAVVLYFVAALYLKFSYVPEDPTILHPPFYKFQGNAFVSYHLFDGAKPDTADNTLQSTLRLYEDGKPLGPAHSMHRDIDVGGHGLYSFWNNGKTLLIFSTSDNSDPNTNGRVYRAVDPDARDPYEQHHRDDIALTFSGFVERPLPSVVSH